MNAKKILTNLAVGDVERTTKLILNRDLNPTAHITKELTSFFVGEDDFAMQFFY